MWWTFIMPYGHQRASEGLVNSLYSSQKPSYNSSDRIDYFLVFAEAYEPVMQLSLCLI